MSSRKKAVCNAVFLILIFGATLYYVFHGQDLSKILGYMKDVDDRLWGFGIICVISFICLESVIIFYLMKSVKQKVRLGHCILYSFVGFFFSCVTPSASGGQPAQIYFMKKDGLSISVSSLILMIVTITYKLVLVVIGAVVLIFRPSGIMIYLEPVIGWCYLGILLNIICIAVMFLLTFHPTMAKKIVIWLICRFQTFFNRKERSEKLIQKVEASMDRYKDVAEYLRKHIMLIIHVFLITFVQRFMLFLITYLVYKSFGFHSMSLLQIVTLQAMISVAVDMLPLPGGMGITEKLFLSIFTPICMEQRVLPFMIATRGLNYYTQLLISAVLTITAYFMLGKAKDKNDRIL